MLLLGWVLVILVGIGGIYQFAKLWYWRHVNIAQSHVHDSDGRKVPSHPPKPIVGNIPDVYKAENRLSAYNAFHQDFGNIVQIMWLWRHQISLASYPMALRILGQNQHQYEKFPPNALLQKLYGTSVLTNNGQQWKQHRL
ncbi:MAG: cytochrome P450, partial [Cyanobacteria bacterium P01_F01_bin.53]